MRNLFVVIFAFFVIAGCASSGTYKNGATRGKASWYGKYHHGKKTASGEIFDMQKLTAAHRTLPFGTKVRVRSLTSNKEVEVRINDRGPFSGGRIIDLSQAAAERLGMIAKGEDSVEFVVISQP